MSNYENNARYDNSLSYFIVDLKYREFIDRLSILIEKYCNLNVNAMLKFEIESIQNVPTLNIYSIFGLQEGELLYSCSFTNSDNQCFALPNIETFLERVKDFLNHYELVPFPLTMEDFKEKFIYVPLNTDAYDLAAKRMDELLRLDNSTIDENGKDKVTRLEIDELSGNSRNRLLI